MRNNRVLRMLTVALLATWSPGSWWCCCRADAAGPQPVEDHVSSCCSAPEAPPARPGRELAGDGCGDDCCPIFPTDAPSCGCRHGAVDAALPAATRAPVTDDTRGPDLDPLVALPPALGAVAAPARAGLACRGSPRHPPTRSLLALHCLLTV